ncbi:MAG: DUF5320 domain-containing protein [Syntrophomonadaceae bacterium]|nr:DUF5320 domain-containing protein [Syntrophomonadaceae bacterium]
MPRGDGTGPLGKGPGNGWGRGNCAGGNRGGGMMPRRGRNACGQGNRGFRHRGVCPVNTRRNNDSK